MEAMRSQGNNFSIVNLLVEANLDLQASVRPYVVYVMATIAMGFIGMLTVYNRFSIWRLHPIDVLATVANMSASMLLWIGLASIALRTIKGSPGSVSDLSVDISMASRVLLVDFIIWITGVVGLVLLVVPGIFVFLVWSQAPFLVLDGRAKHLDSLKTSRKMTKGFRWKILMIYLVLFGVTAPLNWFAGKIGSLETSWLTKSAMLVVVCLSSLVTGYGAFVGARIYARLTMNTGTPISNGTRLFAGVP